MFNFKKIKLKKKTLSFFFKKRKIIFERFFKIDFFFYNNIFILHGGNRFLKKKVFIFNLKKPFSLYKFSKKPFRKPITNKMKLKIIGKVKS